MNIARKPLPGLLALAAALAMPMAFAQTTPPPTDPAQAAPAAEPRQVTWADLDTDKDGSLTKTEVAAVPSLAQVFDQADADGDGKMTADEYKAFAAAGTQAPPAGG